MLVRGDYKESIWIENTKERVSHDLELNPEPPDLKSNALSIGPPEMLRIGASECFFVMIVWERKLGGRGEVEGEGDREWKGECEKNATQQFFYRIEISFSNHKFQLRLV